MVNIEVNGERHDLETGPDDTAVDLLRDRLGLTGTKQVCGAGVCGACTVALDGEPVVSCLLPAAALDGRSVTTVEGLARAGHPVQRAFVAHAAMQCGFCTPGFVVEAVAFHDRWRAEHGTAEPSPEQVAAAMAGHLCRCGAYTEIHAAVRDACAGRFDEPADVTGPRREAADKVSGQARYTVDVVHDGQLEGRILRSPHPHARVRSIDLSGALAVDGVRAAVELLGDDRLVRYVGQEVAAVAAVDQRAADAALERVVVDYAPLPAVIGAEQAAAEGAPVVYARGNRKPPTAGEGPPAPARWRGNVRGPVGSFSQRRRQAGRLIERARASGDPLLVEGVYRTPSQLHTAFEPHATVARFAGDTLEVHASTQGVAALATEIAKHFGLVPERVRVIAEHVGGGFGAKAGLRPETIAAIRLAKESGAPVRVTLDRSEEHRAAGHRPPVRIELSLLAGRDRLTALRVAAHADSGVAVGSTVAALARLIYPATAKELLDYDVVTNTMPGAPFRGPGGPVLCFALEQAVDEAALRLGQDPIELRRRWDPLPARQRLYRWAANLPAWRERDGLPRTGRYRRGIGVAAANWLYLWEPDCPVELRVERGRLVVGTAAQDIGTGTRSVLAATVATRFGLAPADVEVRLGDSRLPRGPGSGGSRVTATVAPAALAAADRLQAALVDALDLAGGRIEPDGIGHDGGLLPWPDAVAKAGDLEVRATKSGDDRALGRAAPRAFAGAGAMGMGFAWMLRLTSNLRIGRGYTGAVHVVEVEVDTRLGRTRVLRVHAGHAVGRLAVPELAAAQAHGAIIQGVGFALYEERVLDPATGRVLSAGLEDYRIPGIADTPEIDLHFDPGGFDHVAGGGVGLGEITTLPVAAAVANAVRDATGVRQYELPIRPDRVLGGLS